MVERQFNRKVQTFRSDNGTEFTSLTNYFLQHGILHKTSCVGTPQQNGRAERKHRHILNVARALRFQSNLPIEFWGECILTAGYLMNRTPSAVLQGKTPFEMLYQKVPDYTHLRVFGSLCYSHNQAHKGDKFASRSRKCVFIGYPYGKKGWRLFDLEKQEFFVSRDVVFFENQFPFSDEPQNITTTISNEEGVLWAPISTGPFVEEENRPNNSLSPLVSPIETPIEENIMSTPSSPSPTPLHDNSAQLSPDSPPATDSSPSPSPTLTLDPPSPSPVPPPPAELLGRGQRRKTQSVTLRNYVTNNAQTQLLDKSGAKTLYPIANYVSSGRFSVSHRAYLAAIVENVEPRSFKLAFSNIRWRHAMRVEVDALEENQTWTLEELPPGKRAIGSKWVYKIKYNSDGTIECYKARLVALGNRQIAGEDYCETFAPVAKMGTVRLFLKVAAGNNWPVYQMDVHNAFLHGDLQEEVYMKPPPGFFPEGDTRVCRLRKSIYGLKQASRCWFAKLTTSLREYGFQQTHADYSLFTFDRNGIKIRMLIYVDDMILTGNNEKALQDFKTYLSSCFKMKDLGHLKYFLGIEVARNTSGFYLSQRKYALDIIAETGLLAAKPAPFPLEENPTWLSRLPSSFPIQHRMSLSGTFHLFGCYTT
ncbi:unnamed protein product [Microthlaspi erraticum]|uniref:Integrase catalytic domain-containing protein n=1 Tax=Microthlaspi erraticum TaxID=1685480 RepID=A0A6D2I001_9BRAS|nr:unnamed protein product [Microthlaspi erraticum]